MSKINKSLSYAQKNCLSKAGRMLYKTSMLRPHSRIGVAVSGGVDSFVLLQILLLQKRKLPFPVELIALHINPGFETDHHRELFNWVLDRGLASHFEVSDMGPRAHSPENRKKSPCFFCTQKRRKRLFELIKKYKLTHIAFGHNQDDLVQNFFMNMMYSGRIEGMYPKESFFQGEFELIRPLLGVEKRVIRKAAELWDLPFRKNPCPSAEDTKRTEIDDWLQELKGKDKRVRKNIYSSLLRWQLEQDSPGD